ncbi:MAG: DUF4147 domain-containing protein [Planctomycetales bacterium]|nr:DUF4147 domain-containing protein [Planctomycetales bacterium]
MKRASQQLREDARRIWWAGVQAVQPKNLIPQVVRLEDNCLWIEDRLLDLRQIERIVIVGAGKAGASMTLALESVLGNRLLQEKDVRGWVNVPADCVQPTKKVVLHAARPAGLNEPTAEGISGTQEILRLVSELGPDDLCLCLISGGGSALLPAPISGLSLESKGVLTREISARGGSIQQLNTVRRELSNIKGGGLARACRAGQLISLILSDVPGDDLETIASGPTVPRTPTPELALQVLSDLRLEDCPAGREAAALLRQQSRQPAEMIQNVTTVSNLLIGNNATAVDAAGVEAERLGYSHAMISASEPEPEAEQVARQLMETALAMRRSGEPDCLISGGEPTVRLAPAAKRGRGGRNQQLALAALAAVQDWHDLALLSGGTDGEDGPTDAAGAFVDEQLLQVVRDAHLDSADYLSRNDAYTFFEQVDGLIKTGPTHTNVCDLRVITVSK